MLPDREALPEPCDTQRDRREIEREKQPAYVPAARSLCDQRTERD